MYRFMIPRRMRKAAETEVPTMPPTLEKPSNLLETAEAVAATTMDVMITILASLSVGAWAVPAIQAAYVE